MKSNEKSGKTRKCKSVVWGGIIGAILITVTILLFVLTGKGNMVVGKNIDMENITEFFYTYASSAFPPEYQRYRFYKENGKYKFYHEKREGSAWPLTESDITLSGSVELSDEEWAGFLDCLKDGTVRKRGENTETGNSAPSLYLYWNGDRSKYQEFSFSSMNTQNSFEELCAKLVLTRGE